MVKERLIHPVILCGGSGTRLWPVSRKALPKPFLPLIGDSTLFEQAIERVHDGDGARRFDRLTIVAGAQQVRHIETQLDGRAHRLIVEPAAKNTAPAIALAAAYLNPHDIMLVCPSDHHIADTPAFRDAAFAAAELAAQDYLVSFGITPDRPETGYGYLKRGEAIEGGYSIAQFVEKPDIDRAKSYLESGEYSWNGGIFAFRAGHLLNELRAHRPAMAELVEQSAAKSRETSARIHPDAEIFSQIEGDSIDYAVMENTARAAMVPADMGWSDIGNWAALQDAMKAENGRADDRGNVQNGHADFINCANVLTSSDGPRISAVGVADLCIVVSDGEVLVTTRDGAQLVGKLPGASSQ